MISESLLKNLKELSLLNQGYKEAAASRSKEISIESSDINLQLIDMEGQIIEAKVTDNESKEKQLLKKEMDLLTKQSLLRQRQENLLKESGYVVEKKLYALVPEIVEAEKEYTQFQKTKAGEIAVIDARIQELTKERSRLAHEGHAFTECGRLITELEASTKLEKGTINHEIRELKGLNRMKNPLFDGYVSVSKFAQSGLAVSIIISRYGGYNGKSRQYQLFSKYRNYQDVQNLYPDSRHLVVFTIKEAESITGVSGSELRRLIGEGKIEATDIDREQRIWQYEIERIAYWWKRHKEQTEPTDQGKKRQITGVSGIFQKLFAR